MDSTRCERVTIFFKTKIEKAEGYIVCRGTIFFGLKSINILEDFFIIILECDLMGMILSQRSVPTPTTKDNLPSTPPPFQQYNLNFSRPLDIITLFWNIFIEESTIEDKSAFTLVQCTYKIFIKSM